MQIDHPAVCGCSGGESPKARSSKTLNILEILPVGSAAANLAAKTALRTMQIGAEKATRVAVIRSIQGSQILVVCGMLR